MSLDSNVRIVFADMEGTLFYPVVKMTHGIAPSSWTLMAQDLGEDALTMEENMKKRWKEGGFKNAKGEQSYLEFMRESVQMHQMLGLKKETFEKAIDVPYHPGVKETYEFFKDGGIKTALISGGFKAQADRAQQDLKIDYALAGCQYFWKEDGTVDHFNLNDSDYLGKVKFVRGIMEQEGADPNQCVFIGDGPNDALIGKEVGISVSFNGCKKLEEACNYVIRQKEGKENFVEVLKVFGDGVYRDVMKTYKSRQ